MRILGLDISTKTGWALVDYEAGKEPRLLSSGVIRLSGPVVGYAGGKYPWSYLGAADVESADIMGLIREQLPDVVVIEEVNLGRSRYAQRILEFIHCQFLMALRAMVSDDGALNVVYVSSSVWRQCLGLKLTSAQRRDNARLSRAKAEASASGTRLNKKALGLRGKVTKKHLALAYANQRYGLQLRVKDNDIADAICLATAYADSLAGRTEKFVPCDGVV
ncbi:MAG: hypothetical protein KGL39_40635 [Patescibacteria group bacterium]|nr:hypothetical protein [Patescibacteria group bacterium]